MTLATTTDMDSTLDEAFEPYRAISKAAIASVILGLFSVMAIFIPALAVLPLVGFLAGVNAYRGIKRYPNELTGKLPAAFGACLCGVLFVSSVTWHSIVYATEVPEGHIRISFEDLQPDDKHPELPVSPKALELNGKKVFIKGYVYPEEKKSGIKKFVLVPDMGTCCFGGQPKLTHMMEVTLADPHRINYSYRKRKLAGELIVDTGLKPVDGLGGVYFQLKADHVK